MTAVRKDLATSRSCDGTSSLRIIRPRFRRMSRIECKWGRTKDFSHLHSILLMWSTASELDLGHGTFGKQSVIRYDNEIQPTATRRNEVTTYLMVEVLVFKPIVFCFVWPAMECVYCHAVENKLVSTMDICIHKFTRLKFLFITRFICRTQSCHVKGLQGHG